MANVICRPELHDATTREQYAEFHAGMQEFGLERTITRNGKVFHLPTGEYLGVNLATSLAVLTLKITALAIRITGRQCKLTLAPVSDPAEIYISGLEEEVSYASELGAFASLFSTTTPPHKGGFMGLAEFASSQPAPSGFSALATLACSTPAPKDIPASLQFGFLTGLTTK